MAAITATIPEPLDAATAILRQVASGKGYTVDDATSTPSSLVLKKGMTLMSWGSQLVITLEPIAGSGVRATIKPSETAALTDWGRGKRAAQKLLTEAGATLD